ncbi:protein trichome birefringence-like 23 isoform X2 [Diospyros lotus]|uniref:protein trichome birefringence-like 23 isoform X2 n=1 Tax=Diospyros lotus TaxID=55363 RepID=UPI0022572053|nr:protein trichome birefringence-like 23 isoform X2 [Diospyros lotus]
MRLDFKNNPFPFSSFSPAHKRNHAFVKFFVCCLLFGLVFRFFFSSSIQLSSDSADPVDLEGTLPPSVGLPPAFEKLPVTEIQDTPSVSDHFRVTETQSSLNIEECDLFTGHWIPNPSGPFYSNESCREIEAHQNCMTNGRPDSGYLYWRWKPRDCELPKFDAGKFLRLMRNKSWAFIGDSIQRNHVQSLLCTLSQVEQAIDVYHDEYYRSRKWHFPSHNFTLSVIWTPFLIKAAIFEDINGVSSADIQLHLDKLDSLWTKQYKNFDYMIIAGGKWFLKTAIYYENEAIKGCHSCQGKNLKELGFEYAYRKGLQLIYNFITSSKHKAYVFFRTATPDHFENGEWFSGGYCNRSAPFKEGEIDISSLDAAMRNIELEEFEKAASMAAEKGVSLKLLDTTRLSLLRPDGHPGVYRQFQPFAKDKNAKVQNDCLHWCLPGPIDSWNDLMMKMLSSGQEL